MPSRPEYIAGARFSAGELSLEQQYRWQHARHHSRFAHGWGVVCGLRVVPANDPRRPWAVRVCPGYAVSPCGDEIEVVRSVVVDIAEWLWALKTGAGLAPAAAVVAIRYAANDNTPVSTPGAACITSERETELSRIADSFRIDVLPDIDIQTLTVDLCRGGVPFCGTPPPFTPYVPLARVLLPSSNLIVPGVIDLPLAGIAT
jgi:hypothetical protein